MLPDVKIKDYYLSFIHNAKNDVVRYEEELENNNIIKDVAYEYLLGNKEDIYDIFNINLNNYQKEFINKEYNSSEHLYNTIIKLLRSTEEHPKRIHLLQIIKYCNSLRVEHRINKKIILASKRKDMKLKDYKKYVSDYYNKVHECVLKGLGYKYSYGIGTYVINHWKLDLNRNIRKHRIDYAATNAKKKELLAKGIKLYDEKEAAWYAARHIPYNAVDYRVYQTSTDWYEFTFINSILSKGCGMEYQRTEYVISKYRGMSYKDMAEKLCKTENDIYTLQVDIKYKLNILLYKDPTKYLNFVRNAEQCKHKR